jgi:hypothetical protein
MKRRSAITVLGVLLVALAFAGQARAVYNGDGTKPNGLTGSWDITDYGKCVSGIKADGTIVIDTAHNLSRPDCIDHVLAADAASGYPTDANYDTQAECIATSGRANGDDVSHFWVSNTCVDPATGAGINLGGLDRTAANCALKGGARINACIGAWTYLGPLGDGAPGFCSTTVDLTSLYASAATCPTTITGYTWTGTKCTFANGIAGYANAAIAKKDGSGNYAAAGTFVDLGALTQGQCLFAGASWSTGTTKAGTTSLATLPLASTVPFDPATGNATITGSRAGCLECHNTVSQYNTYAERWKEPYRFTGHKNMLRKVTAGNVWAGPDGVPYTADASGHAINFGAATLDVGGVNKPLMYLFGDWMAPVPNAIYDDGAGVAKTDSGSAYSCAACHATGWSNPTAGVCSLSHFTTSATCTTGGGTWYPSSGVQGAAYVPAEPLASFPGITSGITGKWDRDGIVCARCHKSLFSQTAPAPAGTSSHNVTPTNTTSQDITNICFGCHQSPATDYATNDKILDPVQIPTGAGHGASWGREFNGHVLGNMFLNSPHARFNGGLVPNSVGKYDLTNNVAGSYSSLFKGMVCRSSTTLGSGSQLETVWKSGAIAEIKSQEDCNLANGFGTPAAPDLTARGYWQAESAGNCATCHDVHQSLFDPAAVEPIRRECGITCHVGKPDWNTLKHPSGAGTPVGDGSNPTEPCIVCHMPKPTAEGFPAHLWRISVDPAYDTFPGQAAFQGGICSLNPMDAVTGYPVNDTSAKCTTAGGTWTAATKDRRAKTAPDGAYAKAVWVDVDLACGQCHGGSAGAGATKNGAPYYDKAYLASWAVGMHSQGATNVPTVASTGLASTGLTASFTDASADNNGQPQNTLAISVNWGDGKISTGVGGAVFSHTYTTPGVYTVIHKATDTGGRLASELLSVTVVSPTSTVVKHSLVVTVVDNATAAPIPGARLNLMRETTSGFMSVRYGYTNASGQLTFTKLLDGKNYKINVYKSSKDFNGTLKGKQAQARSAAILMDADHTLLVTQGGAATNGPAAYPWKGTDGGVTVFTVGP